MKVEKNQALKELAESQRVSKSFFIHGTLEVEVYKPKEKDLQQPHTRDEVYVIISGSGEFINNGERTSFATGDFLFVPAGGMALLTAFWGIWHLVTGLIIAAFWGYKPVNKEKLV